MSFTTSCIRHDRAPDGIKGDVEGESATPYCSVLNCRRSQLVYCSALQVEKISLRSIKELCGWQFQNVLHAILITGAIVYIKKEAQPCLIEHGVYE